jgi:indole-3-glycerol phosphate synthase
MTDVRGKFELFIAEVTKYEGLYDEFEQRLDEINKALSADIVMVMINRLNQLDLKTMSERASSLDLEAPEESLVDQLLLDARHIVRHLERLTIEMRALLKRPMG